MCIDCYCKLSKKQLRVVNSIKKFYKRIDDLGGTVIGEYKGSGIRVECRCKNDHICNPIPDIIQKGNGMCSRCPKNSSIIAEQNFHDNIKKLGGTVIGKYTNNYTAVECRCKNDHICNPTPSNIKQGWGMCKICVGHDPETAEQNFRDNIKKLGGKVIGEYINALIGVKCICSEGHPCNPKPNSIQQGGGMCGICAENDSEFAKQNFHGNIKKLGGTVIGKYKDNKTPVECRCKNDHICNPTPNYIQQGGGMCRICVGHDPETAEQNFHGNIKKLGGTVIGKYKNNSTPVECRCKNDHICNPIPNWIQYGGGMCIICVGHDPETAEQNFRDNIKKLGGTVIGKYKDTKTSVDCICSKGHHCNPIPNNIQQGGGMCGICVGSSGEFKMIECFEELGFYEDEDYIHDSTFPELTKYCNKSLRFDFMFINHKRVFEYDGEQHERPVRFGGISQEEAEERFKKQQEHDKLKDDFCRENGYKMVRISYKDYKNILSILHNELMDIME